MTVPSIGGVTWFGQVLKPLEYMRYVPVIELQYLGEMAELDNEEIAATYPSLCKMEVVLLGAGVVGGVKNVNKLKVLKYKKAIQIPDADT